jgi:hypothetical protein
MEKTWQTFLNQLPLTDAEITYDDLKDWLPGEFDCLKRDALLADLPPATRVVCDACQESHWELVRWANDPARPYTVCAAGITYVRLERLQRWRVDQAHFATWLSRALGLSGDRRRVPESRIWHLGQRKLGSRNPYFFLAAVEPDEQESAIAEIRRAYGRVTGVVLVAFSPLVPAEGSKLQVLDLNLVTSLRNDALIADISLIEDQFTDSRPTHSDDGVRNEKQPSRQLVAHRRAILKSSFGAFQVNDMGGLALKLGTNRTALYGMTRDDTSKYGDDNLTSVLKRLACPRTKWDHIPKRAPRA